MTNYFDEVPEEKEDVYKFAGDMECYIMQHKSRFSLNDAVQFDKDYVNELLNKDYKDPAESEAAKYMIASIIDGLAFTLLDSNETANSWDQFLQERLGPKKYSKYIGEWLQRQGNEFFNRVGMPEEMKPSAIYLFEKEEDD